MAQYLFQAAYSTEAWAAQVKNPENRVEAVRSSVERLGGHIEHAFFTFGEYDILAIIDFPENVNAAAWAIATAAAGTVRTGKTTPLMSIEDGLEALRRAGGAGYRPPGG